jgi:hypothetical protein
MMQESDDVRHELGHNSGQHSKWQQHHQLPYEQQQQQHLDRIGRGVRHEPEMVLHGQQEQQQQHNHMHLRRTSSSGEGSHQDNSDNNTRYGLFVGLPFRTRVHIYMHAYIHTYIDTYIHTYIHTYAAVYIQTCIHTYIHTYVHTYIRTSYIHTYIHTWVVPSIVCSGGRVARVGW